MSHLVLSKDKIYFKKNSKNIYLGPWEMSDITKSYFYEYDLIIPEWHWDDLDKLYEDSKIINKIYKELILKLGEVLNDIHGFSWSTREWQILVGPWFKRFISIIYERYETIKKIYDSYDLKSCSTSNYSINDLQFKDFNDFSLISNENQFQQIVYSYILKKLDKKKKIIFNEIKISKKKIFVKKKKKNLNFKKNIKNFFF